MGPGLTSPPSGAEPSLRQGSKMCRPERAVRDGLAWRSLSLSLKKAQCSAISPPAQGAVRAGAAPAAVGLGLAEGISRGKGKGSLPAPALACLSRLPEGVKPNRSTCE